MNANMARTTRDAVTPLVVAISGSPAPGSRTLQLSEHVAARLRTRELHVESFDVRDLPPDDLIYARTESPAVARALELVERALGVVILTPVYKASFTGVLKTFLDLLPQFGLRGKVVLPLTVGGTNAHVLALDYALRPVLLSLGAQHDKLLSRDAAGALAMDAEIVPRFDGVIEDFIESLHRRSRVSA